MFQYRKSNFSPSVAAIQKHLGAVETELEKIGRIAGRQTSDAAAAASDQIGDAISTILSEMVERFRKGGQAAGIPAGPINDLQQVFADPQVVHRGMRLELKSEAAKGGVIPGIRTPIMLDGAPMASERPSPRLGEHTAEILREIGEG